MSTEGIAISPQGHFVPRARVILGDDSEAGSNILDVAFCTRTRLTTAPEIENTVDRGPFDIYATRGARRHNSTKHEDELHTKTSYARGAATPGPRTM